MKALAIGGSTLVIVALVALILLWRGAPRPAAPPPPGQFQLSVISDSRSAQSWNVQLKVVAATPRDAYYSGTGLSIQITHPGGSGGTSAMPGGDGRTYEATVGLNASIVQSGGSSRLRTSFPLNTNSGSTGGSSESDTTAQSVTAVAQFTAKPGLYPKGVPLTLGTLNGKPIQLTVGSR